jgi:glycosyltransferase involved in cell wall biosynthesis
MTLMIFAAFAFSAALFNAILFFRNLQLYRPPPEPEGSNNKPLVSVLIPARNEERSIRAAVEAVLSSRDVGVELIVLDDHSEDGTSQIVREMAHDDRLRLEFAPDLPAGWCGKQFACLALARLASHDVLVFLDADVRLYPSGLARMVAFLQESKSELVSGFPHQEVRSFYERLLLPLMHFLLLGFLPHGPDAQRDGSFAERRMWTDLCGAPVCVLEYGEDMQLFANRGTTAFFFPGHFVKRAFAPISAMSRQSRSAACTGAGRKFSTDC